MLTFWHSLGGPAAQVLQENVDRYNETHATKVQIVVIAPQEYSKAAQEALENPPQNRPNLVLVPEFLTGKFKLKAQTTKDLVPINSLLDEENISQISEFVRTTFGNYSLPLNPACGVLYKNNDALQKIGKGADWVPATFEEMIQACRDLKAIGMDYGFTCAWPESYLVEAVLSQTNRPLIVPNNGVDGYGTYQLSTLTDHVLVLWELVQEGIFLPPNPGNYDPTREPFVKGKTAFYMQGSGHFSVITKEVDDFHLGVSALPTLSMAQPEPKHSFPLGGAAVWAFNVEPNPMADSESLEQMKTGVREFLNFLASEEFQSDWHKKTAYVPVRKSLIESLKDFHQENPLHKAVVDQTINAPAGENCFGIKMPNYGDARKEIYPLLFEIFQLKGAKEEVRQAIAEKLKDFDEKWSIPGVNE